MEARTEPSQVLNELARILPQLAPEYQTELLKLGQKLLKEQRDEKEIID